MNKRFDEIKKQLPNREKLKLIMRHSKCLSCEYREKSALGYLPGKSNVSYCIFPKDELPKLHDIARKNCLGYVSMYNTNGKCHLIDYIVKDP
jgi:hypothetical protein